MSVHPRVVCVHTRSSLFPGPDAGVLLVGTTNGSIIAVGIFSSSEVSVALRTSAAAILVRGHMGDVNNVACDSDKQVLLLERVRH